MWSSACRITRFLLLGIVSSLIASTHSLTDVLLASIALRAIIFAFGESLLSRMFSSQASSLLGHCVQPLSIVFRAVTLLPANSSSRAAAIQPKAFVGFVLT